MAKLKKIGAGTANARMSSIINEFGIGSEVYQMASDYIEERVDEKFIKRNKAGDIIGIRQTKEAKDKLGENVFGRSDIFNEYLPTTNSIYKKVMEEEGYSGTIKANKDVLRPLVEVYAHKMGSYDDTVLDVYDVRDNTDALDADVYAAHDFHGRAVALLKIREKTSEWIDAARALVDEYEIEVQKERQSR